MAFPSTLSSFSRPNATDRLNSPSHSALHNTVSSAVGQLEAVIGVDGANSILGTIIGDLRSPGSGGGGHIQTAVKGGTGQITFAKGDVLVAQSASVLAKLSVGSNNTVLTADSTQSSGVKWAGVAGMPTIRSYTIASTLTWVKPSVITYLAIEVVGAGGGGAGCASGNGGSGGGGAGGYGRKVYIASNLGANETVVIGTGGVAGTAGNNNGSAGGNSSFSTGANSVIGAGGNGGSGGAGAQGVGGAGASALNAHFSVLGGYGGYGMPTDAASARGFGGYGGASYFGGGASMKGVTSGSLTGDPGQAPGSGGGGAASQSGAVAGGAGADGAVIIYEY